MLIEPSQRLTAEQCLEHKWMMQNFEWKKENFYLLTNKTKKFIFDCLISNKYSKFKMPKPVLELIFKFYFVMFDFHFEEKKIFQNVKINSDSLHNMSDFYFEQLEIDNNIDLSSEE